MPFEFFMGDDAEVQVETLRDVKQGIDEARTLRSETARSALTAAECLMEMRHLVRCVYLVLAGCSVLVAVVLLLIFVGH